MVELILPTIYFMLQFICCLSPLVSRIYSFDGFTNSFWSTYVETFWICCCFLLNFHENSTELQDLYVCRSQVICLVIDLLFRVIHHFNLCVLRINLKYYCEHVLILGNFLVLLHLTKYLISLTLWSWYFQNLFGFGLVDHLYFPSLVTTKRYSFCPRAYLY